MESSPFTSRLDSNYVATDSESLEIQALLKAPTSRLDELSIRLKELDDQYTQIQNEQTSLLLSISQHRALMSLVRKLPIDILQEIFIACLPTSHNAVMSRWEPPMLLTQVCSPWRQVAHATPQLWKSIHIVIPCNSPNSGIYASEYPNFQSTAKQVAGRRSEAVLEWLTRSASCPLDISLSHWENSTPDGFCEKIVDYLIRFSERWRRIAFSAPYEALIPVAALPTSKVPLLESLSLNSTRLHFSPAYIYPHLDPLAVWIKSGVVKAPRLRDISLHQLHEDVTRLPINWNQLTNLSLEGTSWGVSSRSLSVSRAYKILSFCQNLISCRLEIGTTGQDEESSETETSTSIISLPFLAKLYVREHNNLSGLFALLHLPSLNSLEFHTAIWPTQGSSTSLLSLLTCSDSTIQDLITDTQCFTRQDFIKCLRLCPSLKSLAIRKVYGMGYAIRSPPPWPQTDDFTCSVDDAFLDMFTSPNDDNNDQDPEGCLCPNLEDFESSSSETAFTESALLQFIKRKNDDNDSEPRIPGLAKLKRISVIFYCRPLNDDINPELDLYKQAGLEAIVSYPRLYAAPFSPFEGLPNTNNQSSYWPPYY